MVVYEGKHINIQSVPISEDNDEEALYNGKRMFGVFNKHDNVLLGTIGWFPKWKKFCFWPQEHTLFEEFCMRDISSFIESETNKEN